MLAAEWKGQREGNAGGTRKGCGVAGKYVGPGGPVVAPRLGWGLGAGV